MASTSKLHSSSLYVSPSQGGRQQSVSTQHAHPPSRIYIGPSPSSSTASSSHTRIPSSETDEPRQRKRDVYRRRRKRTNSGAEWGEHAFAGGVRGWVTKKVGGDSDEALINQTGQGEDEDEDDDEQGLGWYRIRWEGETTRSRSNTVESITSARPELNPSASPHQIRPARPTGDDKVDPVLSSQLTSSPLSTPLITDRSTSTLELPQLTRPEGHPSAFALTDPSSSSPLRPPPISKASNVSSVKDSFVTARSSISGSTDSLPPSLSTSRAQPDSASSKTVTPPRATKTTTLPSQPLPTFEHTPASPVPSVAAAVPPSPPRHTSPPPARNTDPPVPLRSAIRGQVVVPKRQQTVHFPLTPAGSGIFPSLGKGKERAVEEEPEPEPLGLEGDAEPADPSVVLGRQRPPPPGDARVENAGQDEDERDFGPRDVILRDRMLVKVQYSRQAGLPNDYDEWAQRRVPADRSEPWEEKLVVLRRGVVEIWEDWVSTLSSMVADGRLTLQSEPGRLAERAVARKTDWQEEARACDPARSKGDGSVVV